MINAQKPTFGHLVLSRAWSGTWAFFRAKIRDAIAGLALAGAGIATYYCLYGWPAAISQALNFGVFTAAPIIGLWLLLFCWNLWLAPTAILYEDRQKATQMVSAAAASIKPKPPINWQPWKHRSEYTFYEFAKILAKTDPSAQVLSNEGSSFLRLLTEDAIKQKLKNIPQYETSQWSNTVYPKSIDGSAVLARDVALKWADDKEFCVDHVK